MKTEAQIWGVTLASIAAGHVFAGSEGGAIRVWGRNDAGQWNVPAGLKHVVAVSAGGQHVLAMRRDGRVFAWGSNTAGQCEVPPSLGSVVELAAGDRHSGVRRTDGSIRLWGTNTFGESTVPSELPSVQQLALGSQRTIALLADGTVRCWGRGDLGSCDVPSGLPPVRIIRPSPGWLTYVLCEDGTVRGWGPGAFPYSAPTATLDLTVSSNGIVSMDASGALACAWPAPGGNVCPIPSGISDAIALSSGEDFAMILRDDGVVQAWGSNLYGQISVPANLPTALSIDGGGSFAVAIVEDLCPADLSGDRSVDGTDLGQLLSEWGGDGSYRAADLDLDGYVDGIDLGKLLAAWGPCPG